MTADTVTSAPVAQSEELGPFKPEVVRSKLTGGTKTSDLPANMQDKIVFELCPKPHLPGFCWAWTGAQTNGYGSVAYEGRTWSTHKLAYTLLIGDVPDGLQLDHLCQNKVCCNPRHLEVVTGKVNCERTDAAQKDRCVNGHPLAGPNLRIKQKVSGLTQRECRMCCALARDRAEDACGRKRKPSGSVARRRAQMLADSEAALRQFDRLGVVS